MRNPTLMPFSPPLSPIIFNWNTLLIYGTKVHDCIFNGESFDLSVNFKEKVIFLQILSQFRWRNDWLLWCFDVFFPGLKVSVLHTTAICSKFPCSAENLKNPCPATTLQSHNSRKTDPIQELRWLLKILYLSSDTTFQDLHRKQQKRNQNSAIRIAE